MSKHIFVTTAFSRKVNYKNEAVHFGSFEVNYNGIGRWYLSSSPTTLKEIYGDSTIGVSTPKPKGRMSHIYRPLNGELIPASAMDITDLLEEGLNSVLIQIEGISSDTIGSSDLYLVYQEKIESTGAASGDDITKAISHYNITQKLNDPCTFFAVKFNIPFDPEEFRTGPRISFQLTDNLNAEDFEVYNGQIQRVGRNIVVGNRTYDISGRDNGYYLTKQNYSVDCTLEGETKTKIIDQLKSILHDTNIKIGLSQTPLKNIELSNNPLNENFFGGEFKPKWKAISALFDVYSKLTGIKKVRWFVDAASTLRWFEIKSNQGQIRPISLDEDIVSLDIEEDSTNIVNSITGTSSSEDKSTIKVEDKQSQAIYGVLEGNPVTYKDVNELYDILNEKSGPVFSGTVTFTGIKDYECGQQLMFPEDSKYGSVIFTITEITKEGSPANPRTTLRITTDENAINPSNLYENVQAIIEKLTNDTTTATVTAVYGDVILAKTEESNTNIPVSWVR